MIRDRDALLRRRELAEALTEAGFPTSPSTLATKVTRGGGPPARWYGRIPLYRWGDALDWAQSRLSGPFRSTSERNMGHAASLTNGRRPMKDQTAAEKAPEDPGRATSSRGAS